MKKKLMFALWVWLYLLCAALGHLQEPSGWQRVALLSLSVLFFLPGGILLYWAYKNKNKTGCKHLAMISFAVLGLTFLLLMANLLAVTGSEALGRALYVLLIWGSAPMVCSGQGLLVLFLWACLGFAARTCYKKL